jgi:hypothetical protein
VVEQVVYVQEGLTQHKLQRNFNEIYQKYMDLSLIGDEIYATGFIMTKEKWLSSWKVICFEQASTAGIW